MIEVLSEKQLWCPPQFPKVLFLINIHLNHWMEKRGTAPLVHVPAHGRNIGKLYWSHWTHMSKVIFSSDRRWRKHAFFNK